MPELPEVETVRRGLQPAMQGQQIVEVEQRRAGLRFAFPPRFAEQMQGQKVLSLSRRAKYLLVNLESTQVLIIHLGMSGSLRIEKPSLEARPGNFHYERGKRAAHDHVVFHMADGTRIVYNDPRRFGFMLLIAQHTLDTHPLFASLGVEPLGNALNADYLAERLKGKTASLKAALLDQRIIAGLGNIYVSEALWKARLSPKRKAGSLVTKAGKPAQKLGPLIRAIQEVMQQAIAAGGSSLRDHTQADGSLGYFQHQFAVYDRAGLACQRPSCQGVIEKLAQSGRSSFWCPACQC